MRGSGRWQRGLRSRGGGSYVKGGGLNWGDQRGVPTVDERGGWVGRRERERQMGECGQVKGS